jgi:hypothetical protein
MILLGEPAPNANNADSIANGPLVIATIQFLRPYLGCRQARKEAVAAGAGSGCCRDRGAWVEPSRPGPAGSATPARPVSHSSISMS